MKKMLHLAIAMLVGAPGLAAADLFTIPSSPNKIGRPLDGYVSYTLEFSSFPDFAGQYP